MTTSAVDGPGVPKPRPRRSVEEMLAAKGTPPIRSVDDLAADTFASDEEVEEFLEAARCSPSSSTPTTPHYPTSAGSPARWPPAQSVAVR